MTDLCQKLIICGNKHLQSQQISQCPFLLWHKEGTTYHLFSFSVFISHLMIGSCSFNFIRVRMMQSQCTCLGDSVWTKPHCDERVLKYFSSVLSGLRCILVVVWDYRINAQVFNCRSFDCKHYPITFGEVSPFSESSEVNARYGLNYSSVFTWSERQEALYQLSCVFYFYSESQITVIWEGEFLEVEDGRKIKAHHHSIQIVWALPLP